LSVLLSNYLKAGVCMTCSSPVLISPLALSKVDYKVLQVAVNLLTEEGLQCNLLEYNNQGGHLAVIDTDTTVGKQMVNQVRVGQVQLVISSQPSHSRGWTELLKPVRVNPLKELLANLCAELNPDKTTSNSVTVKENTPPVPDALNETIFDILYNAKQNDLCLRISWDQGRSAYINGKTNTVATALSQKSMDSLFTTPIDLIEAKNITLDVCESVSHTLNILALDGVLWQAAVLCSRGRILSGHSLDTPVKLKAWPNFTRQSFNPHFLRLAAVLARQAITLNQLKSETQVPLKDIVNFYNAVYAVGLIEFQNQKIESRTVPRKTSLRLRDIFSRLVVRLKIA
jgi:hypothetical protein